MSEHSSIFLIVEISDMFFQWKSCGIEGPGKRPNTKNKINFWENEKP